MAKKDELPLQEIIVAPDGSTVGTTADDSAEGLIANDKLLADWIEETQTSIPDNIVTEDDVVNEIVAGTPVNKIPDVGALKGITDPIIQQVDDSISQIENDVFSLSSSMFNKKGRIVLDGNVVVTGSDVWMYLVGVKSQPGFKYQIKNWGIISSAANFLGIAFYDETGNLISGYSDAEIDSVSFTAIAPEGTAFVGFSYDSRYSTLFLSYNKIDGISNEINILDNKTSIIKTNQTDNRIIIDEYYPFIDNSAVVGNTFTPNDSYKRTDFENCQNWGGSFILSKGQNYLCSFFETPSLDTFISGETTSSAITDLEIQIPSKAKYVVINNRKTSVGVFTVKAKKDSISAVDVLTYDRENVESKLRGIRNELDAISIIDERFKDKTFSVMGDSISAFPYSNVPELTESQMWYMILISRVLALKGLINGIAGTNIANSNSGSFINRYNDLDLSTTDYLIIEGAMNDLGFQNVPLGIFDYNTPLTSQLNTEFIPAYRMLIEGLRTKYPNLKIILCTISIRAIGQTVFPWKNATTGHTWVEYNEAIRKLAFDYGCGLIDFARAMTFQNANIFTTDGVHPTIDGMALMGNQTIQI